MIHGVYFGGKNVRMGYYGHPREYQGPEFYYQNLVWLPW